MIDVVHIVLFTFLAVIAIAIIRLRDLFAAVMLMGIFSLLSASLFTVMDAVDVAFTEAAVGAGISTILMLATLSLTTSKESTLYQRPQPMALVAVVLTGAALIYATFDMPRYGDPGSADPPPRGRPLHRGHRQRDRRAQHGHRDARLLPRLRHLGRDDGDLHRLRRGVAAARRWADLYRWRHRDDAAMEKDGR